MRATKISQTLFAAVICLAMSTVVGGCAKSADVQAGYKAAEINDPLEPFNRGVFAVNNVVDMFLIEPVAKIYNALFPGFVRDGVQNFMRNVKSPLVIANSLLQGDLMGARDATARFLINTTAGIGGLVDVASAQGFAYKPEDFGQTLAKWGVGNGFYLVLPVIGPSSLRDAGGLAVDTLADPVRIYAQNTDNDWIYYDKVIIDGLDTRARLVKAVEDLRRNSLDYYAAVRSSYAQKRGSLIRNENVEGPGAIPAYDEQN